MNKITSILRLTNKFKQLNFNQSVLKRFCSNELTKPNLQKHQESTIIPIKNNLVETNYEFEIENLINQDENSIFKPPKENLSDIAQYTKPAFNFAAYINKSETLQNLVNLGVDLYKIERRKGAPEIILQLDYEKVKKYILFLNDYGVEDMGKFLTKNPFIFKENIEDLQIRINYLEFKKFDRKMIIRILNKNPYWLSFSTQRIDRKLGHFQKNFQLTGEETRFLATREARLITYNMNHIKLNTFCIKEEMGFMDSKQLKKLLLDSPKLWMMARNSILERFDYLHNTMKISHEQLLLFPNVLKYRKSKLKQRHQFLLKLNRAQYDAKKENYVSLKDIVEGTDTDFCKNIAKSSVDIYNTFLKSL